MYPSCKSIPKYLLRQFKDDWAFTCPYKHRNQNKGLNLYGSRTNAKKIHKNRSVRSPNSLTNKLDLFVFFYEMPVGVFNTIRGISIFVLNPYLNFRPTYAFFLQKNSLFNFNSIFKECCVILFSFSFMICIP